MFVHEASSYGFTVASVAAAVPAVVTVAAVGVVAGDFVALLLLLFSLFLLLFSMSLLAVPVCSLQFFAMFHLSCRLY